MHHKLCALPPYILSNCCKCHSQWQKGFVAQNFVLILSAGASFGLLCAFHRRAYGSSSRSRKPIEFILDLCFSSLKLHWVRLHNIELTCITIFRTRRWRLAVSFDWA